MEKDYGIFFNSLLNVQEFKSYFCKIQANLLILEKDKKKKISEIRINQIKNKTNITRFVN